MKITIERFLGIPRLQASFTPNQPTVIYGDNASGKTSLACAIAAMLAHDDDPLGFGSRQKRFYSMQRGGAEKASGDPRTSIRFGDIMWQPSSGFTVPPDARALHPHGLGLIDFLAKRTSEARLALWEDLFIPDDPAKLLEMSTMDDEIKSEAIEIIRYAGWHQAGLKFRGVRVDAKREWEKITGEHFKSDTASQWLPDGWSDTLYDADFVEIESTIDALRKKIREAEVAEINESIYQKAFSGESVEILREEVQKLHLNLESIGQELQIEKSKFTSLSDEERQAQRTKHNSRKVLDAVPQFVCPLCEGDLEISRSPADGKQRIIPWNAPSNEDRILAREFLDSEIAKEGRRAKAMAKLKRSIASHEIAYSKAMADLQKARGALQEREAIIEKANRVKSSVQKATGDISHYRFALEKTENELRMARDWRAAQELYTEYVKNDIAYQHIGPQGVRKDCLQKGLAGVNSKLKRVAEITTWSPASLGDGGEILINGRPAQISSQSEKFCAQVALQVACALHTRSSWIIIDAADILRGEFWKGLIRLVKELANPKRRAGLHIYIFATDPPGNTEIDCVDIKSLM